MDSKIFNGKRYLFGGALPTKQKANQEAKAYRKMGYFARVDREHFSRSCPGAIAHPENVKAGRMKTIYRVWYRKPEGKSATCGCRGA